MYSGLLETEYSEKREDAVMPEFFLDLNCKRDAGKVKGL